MQMGSRMKKSIFDEQTSKALKKWHNAVKKRKKEERLGKAGVRNLNVGGGSTVGLGSSKPSWGPALHRFKTIAHSTRSSTFMDDVDVDVDVDVEDQSEAPMLSTTNLTHHEAHENEPLSAEETLEEGDFSFRMSPTVEAGAGADPKL